MSKSWQPSIPLSDVHPLDIDAAHRLQRALRRALAFPPGASIAERLRVAADDYRREFGHAVSERTLTRAIARTLQRDGGERRFDRVELYLGERLRSAPQPAPAASISIFPDLDAEFSALADRTRPTTREVSHCWRKIVQGYAERIEQGADAARLKPELRAYLWAAAPFLAKSPNALKVTLNRKLARYETGGAAALCDARWGAARAKKLPPDWAENIALLARWARQYSVGGISLAWRQCYKGKVPGEEQFSAAFRDFYAYDWRRDKSCVPARVRDAVRPILAATDALHHGPKTARLARASIHRAWPDDGAGRSYTSDDVTWNHYFYDWAADGDFEFDGRRFNVTRGQCLPLLDERTDYPLGFWLTPRASYDSRDIRALVSVVCSREEIGLPLERFVFERGIWDSRNVNALDRAAWRRADESLCRLGVEVHHATTAKAKVVERALGALQNLMEPLPGYVGRDERKDRYERMQSALQRLKRTGQPLKPGVHPGEFLLSKDELAAQLEKVLRTFAAEPQNGKRLRGLSPAEGWEQLHDDRAHVVLPDSLRYLLNGEASEQSVGREGVRVRMRGEDCFYHSARLGELLGEKVRVRFNPFIPEQVMVCHLRGDPQELAPFAVPLAPILPAHGATREQFRAARAASSAFASFAAATYRVLVPRYARTLRDENLGSEETRTRGGIIAQAETEAVALRGRRDATGDKIARLAGELGLRIDARGVSDPDATLAKLERMKAARAGQPLSHE